MSFNFPSLSKSKPKTTPDGDAEKKLTRRATDNRTPKREKPRGKKLIKVKTETKSLKVDQLGQITKLFKHLKLEEADGAKTSKLLRDVAKSASKTKHPHLFRDEIKDTAKSLSNDMKGIISQNLKKVDPILAEGGVVLLQDILDSCELEPVQLEIVETIVTVQQFVPQTVMPPAPSTPTEAKPRPLKNPLEKDLLAAMEKGTAIAIYKAAAVFDEHLSALHGGNDAKMRADASDIVDRVFEHLEFDQLRKLAGPDYPYERGMIMIAVLGKKLIPFM